MTWRRVFAMGQQSVRPTLRRVRQTYNHHLANLMLRTSLRSPQAILVHQMGKVGSSSVVASLKNAGLDVPIYQTHFLNRERLDARLTNLRSSGQALDYHLIVSQHLRRQLDEGLRGKDWRVVTLVREPIARNISAFFQNLEEYLPDWSSRFHSGSLTLEEVMDTFLNDYPHDIPLTWLDLEIGHVFGIDVFSSDFPRSKGYQVLEGENVALLLMRLENLRECYGDAFAALLGMGRFELKNANVAKDKDYWNAYEEFKEAIVLPPDYVRRMYESEYTQHFYSAEEISAFRTRWSA
jgi:hypothetical protein